MSRNAIYLNNNQSDVDMTPMLDIVFILLIFFIVSTSFLQEIGLEASRPKANNHPGEPLTTIRIDVKKSGDIWMNGRLVDVARIPANVERLLSQGAQEKVLVDADDKSKHQLLVSVLDQIKTIEGMEVSIISKAH